MINVEVAVVTTPAMLRQIADLLERSQGPDDGAPDPSKAPPVMNQVTADMGAAIVRFLNRDCPAIQRSLAARAAQRQQSSAGKIQVASAAALAHLDGKIKPKPN